MEYTYTNPIASKEALFRVYFGLAWREYSASGKVLAASQPHALAGAFPADYDPTADCARLKPAPVPVAYIRFGALPARGYSVNHATGRAEAGVSAYRAVWDITNNCYRPYGALIGAELYHMLLHGARDIYLITGEEIIDATGSDGEPLLRNAKIAARLTMREGHTGYFINVKN